MKRKRNNTEQRLRAFYRQQHRDFFQWFEDNFQPVEMSRTIVEREFRGLFPRHPQDRIALVHLSSGRAIGLAYNHYKGTCLTTMNGDRYAVVQATEGAFNTVAERLAYWKAALSRQPNMNFRERTVAHAIAGYTVPREGKIWIRKRKGAPA